MTPRPQPSRRNVARPHPLHCLAISLVLAMGVAPPLAQAQESAIQISMPAQPLSDALINLANRFELELAYAPDMVSGLQAPALSGVMTADQALQQLLSNTGVQYRRNGNRVSLSRTGAKTSTVLAPITVTGATGGLPPAYAGGQLTSASRVGMLGNKDFMETPFSTRGYTRDAIENTQSGNLLRVISDTDPAVSTTGNDYDLSNYAAMHIRGFNSAGMEDLGINGLHGLASYGNRSLGDFAERVEVFKGPSALLNGMMPNGNIAGTVNTVTKRATDKPITRIGVGYESRSIYTAKIDLGRRFDTDNRWGVRLNASKRAGDTAIRHKSLDNQAAGLGIDYRGDRLRVGFDWIHNQEHTDGVTAQLTSRLTEIPNPPTHDKLIAGEPWTLYETRGNLFMLKGEYDISDHTMAWASVGLNDRRMTANVMNWRLLNLDGDFARDSVLIWNSKFRNTAADAGLQTRFETGPIRHQLSINANASKRTVHQARVNLALSGLANGNIYDPTYVPRPDAIYSPDMPKSNENTLYSIGVADTLSMLDDRLQLTVGVRRQNVRQKTFNATTGQVQDDPYDASATTPALAALFRLTDRVSVYANYIEGLSAGAQAPATAANAGEVFAPYKSKQKEAGVKFDSGNLATTLAVFEITRPSAITDPVTGIYSFGGEQRNRGVEWEIFGSPAKGLRLMGGLSWKQAKLTQTQGGINQGNQAPEVPRFEAKFGIAYDVAAVPGLTLSANAIHTAKQYLDQANTQSIPSWRRYDVGFAYTTQISSIPVTLRGTVFNVADSRYWYGVLWRGVSQPRTLNLSATFEF